jgi:hypothetical protein
LIPVGANADWYKLAGWIEVLAKDAVGVVSRGMPIVDAEAASRLGNRQWIALAPRRRHQGA